MSSLPVRARRAVLSGATTARHRASTLHVRRRSADGDDRPLGVDALIEASLSQVQVATAAEPHDGSRTVDLDGPVHYVDHGGDGPPLVAVHGLGGSHANWHDLGPLLTPHARVYALDLAGHGRTPRAGRSASVRANRLLLDRFLTEVVGEPAVLVGNSMGGTIAMLQSAEQPETVRDLVLIGPAGPRVGAAVPDLAVARQAALFAVPGVGQKVLARRLDKLGAEAWVQAQMSLTTADVDRVSRELRRVAVELVASRAAGPDAEAAFLEAARSLVALLARGARYREVVAAVRGRALVVHGELDRLVPLASSRALAQQRPDWRLEVLEGVGHVPQIEVPERTAALITGWLTRRPTGVPR